MRSRLLARRRQPLQLNTAHSLETGSSSRFILHVVSLLIFAKTRVELGSDSRRTRPSVAGSDDIRVTLN